MHLQDTKQCYNLCITMQNRLEQSTLYINYFLIVILSDHSDFALYNFKISIFQLSSTQYVLASHKPHSNYSFAPVWIGFPFPAVQDKKVPQAFLLHKLEAQLCGDQPRWHPSLYSILYLGSPYASQRSLCSNIKFPGVLFHFKHCISLGHACSFSIVDLQKSDY